MTTGAAPLSGFRNDQGECTSLDPARILRPGASVYDEGSFLYRETKQVRRVECRN